MKNDFLVPTGTNKYGDFTPLLHKNSPLEINGVKFTLEKNGKKVKVKTGKLVRTIAIDNKSSVFSIVMLDDKWHLIAKDKPSRLLTNDSLAIPSALWDLGFTNQKLATDGGMRLADDRLATKAKALEILGLADSNSILYLSNGIVSLVLYKPEQCNKCMPLLYNVKELATMADFEDIKDKLLDYLSKPVNSPP